MDDPLAFQPPRVEVCRLTARSHPNPPGRRVAAMLPGQLGRRCRLDFVCLRGGIWKAQA